MAAALLMVMIRTTLRAMMVGLDGLGTAETILARTNAHLYDDFTDVGMLATLFIGHYSRADRLISYANAGHSPVLYCPAGGPAQLLEADGPTMGVLPISLSENQTIPFGPGDLLVVLTDGFNEACDAAGEFFGIERLERLVEETATRSAREIAQALFAEVGRFSAGRPQDDDQTILVVKGVD